MKKFIIFILLFLGSKIFAQKTVAFTIDDVPNTGLFKNAGYHSRLMEIIDSLHLPVAIFINEERLYYTDSVTKNFELLNEWIKNPLVTMGNHTFSHPKYSDVGIETFKTEILKGEAISAELAKKYHKKVEYFRSPYNDLGKNAEEHRQLEDYLKSLHYISTPFTVHSEDWLFTQLYEYYISHNQYKDAKRIGNQYVTKTLGYFDYIESLTDKKLNRNVKHIYLMHDNLLNADYLEALVSALKQRDYNFITLKSAMTDPIYAQKDHYQEKAGISWVYRWIEYKQERIKLQRREPNMEELENELTEIKK